MNFKWRTTYSYVEYNGQFKSVESRVHLGMHLLNGWHTTIECNWLTSCSYVEFNSEFKPYTLFICVPICTVCAYMLTMMVSSSVCSTCMLCISRWYVFDSRCWLWLNHNNRSIKHYNLRHSMNGDISRSICIITKARQKRLLIFSIL